MFSIISFMNLIWFENLKDFDLKIRVLCG